MTYIKFTEHKHFIVDNNAMTRFLMLGLLLGVPFMTTMIMTSHTFYTLSTVSA